MTEEENCVLEFVSVAKLSLLEGCIIQALEGVFFAMACHLTAMFCLVLCSLVLSGLVCKPVFLNKALIPHTWGSTLVFWNCPYNDSGPESHKLSRPVAQQGIYKGKFLKEVFKVHSCINCFPQAACLFCFFFPWHLSVFSVVFFHQALLSCRRKTSIFSHLI